MRGVRHFSDFLDRTSFDWETECWNWKMSLTKDGYGRVGYYGTSRLAHRLSKFLFGHMTEMQFNNPKAVVMHACDNPACVNPHHTSVGTQAENMKDRAQKLRSAKHLENRDIYGQFTKKE